jgi:PAT family beta-lactamase induction signal transducer AmpG
MRETGKAAVQVRFAVLKYRTPARNASTDPVTNPKVGKITSEGLIAPRPWLFVLTLCFLGGIPDSLVSNGAVLFYKSIGYSNTFVGALGLLYAPYATAFLWSPIFDREFTKRFLVVAVGLVLAVLFGLLAVLVASEVTSSWATLTVVGLIAIAGATYQTIAIKGFCLHALSKAELTILSGVGMAGGRVGIVFGSSLLVALSAYLTAHYGRPDLIWALVFGTLALTLLMGTVYHWFALSRPKTDVAGDSGTRRAAYVEVIREVSDVPRIGIITFFFLIYRFGEGLLVRMTVPFFLDSAQHGGLGYSVGTTAFMTGGAGFGFTILGGLLGAWIIKRFTLRRVMLPLALCMLLPHATYVYLAATRPSGLALIHLGSASFTFNPQVLTSICIEYLGYGLGYSGSTYLQFLVCRGRYRASLFAFVNALISIGWLLPLVFSGWLQARIGYQWLFVASIVAALPGTLCIFRLPIAKLEAAEPRRGEPAPAC